jgi:hypothetical protein
MSLAVLPGDLHYPKPILPRGATQGLKLVAQWESKAIKARLFDLPVATTFSQA